jgi:hypothetical protein
MGLVILGWILELSLEGMDGYAGHPVPNDSVAESLLYSSKEKPIPDEGDGSSVSV